MKKAKVTKQFLEELKKFPSFKLLVRKQVSHETVCIAGDEKTKILQRKWISL